MAFRCMPMVPAKMSVLDKWHFNCSTDVKQSPFWKEIRWIGQYSETFECLTTSDCHKNCYAFLGWKWLSVWSLTWSGVAWIAPWLVTLAFLAMRPIPGIGCWFPLKTCLGMAGECVCWDTTMFCCLAGFQAGGPWVWTGGVGVLPLLCWPGDILCTACWAEGWELTVPGCWDAGESVRLLTGRGLDFLFNPARTYCTFTPDCTLRSWPSGKANL